MEEEIDRLWNYVSGLCTKEFRVGIPEEGYPHVWCTPLEYPKIHNAFSCGWEGYPIKVTLLPQGNIKTS